VDVVVGRVAADGALHLPDELWPPSFRLVAVALLIVVVAWECHFVDDVFVVVSVDLDGLKHL
jgi:hypothetical protein